MCSLSADDHEFDPVFDDQDPTARKKNGRQVTSSQIIQEKASARSALWFVPFSG